MELDEVSCRWVWVLDDQFQHKKKIFEAENAIAILTARVSNTCNKFTDHSNQ